ncbi:MAG: DUF3618 domain-containing protein [Solirubrobacterales bacterium]|nr:DUF3618 domain-containing protein [Solirubrobacterales bacterium]
MEATPYQVTTTGNGRYVPPAPGTRSAEQIRDDVTAQRHDLARSVDALRDRWSEATDVKGQIAKHKTELLVGAAVVGFAVGAVIAFRRRR